MINFEQLATEFFSFMIRLFWIYLKILWWILALLFRLIVNLSKGVFSFRENSAILQPGDSPLQQPTRDLKDYRGIADLSEVRSLRQQSSVYLGRYTTPRGTRKDRVYLSDHLLQHHVAMIGPPGSGKSSNLMEPWVLQLLQQGNSVVIVDIKGELFQRLGQPAQQAGYRVWYWDSNNLNSQSWNWLEEIQEPRDIESAVESILGRPNPNDPQPFFRDRDRRWLRTLISIVKEINGDCAEPQELLELVSDQEHLYNQFERYSSLSVYLSQINDLLRFSLEEHSKAVSGLLNSLNLFSLSNVQRVSQISDFHLKGLDQQPTLLIIGASLAGANVSETLSSLMLGQLFNHVYRRFERGSSSNVRPLYFVIDEAARLNNRINFEQVLSIARAAKVGVCLALQDVNQLGNQQQYSAILNNCQTFIAFKGCSHTTAQYFSSRLGQRNASNLSLSNQREPFQLFGSSGRNIQHTTVPVLSDREIMYLPFSYYGAVVQVAQISPKPFLVSFDQQERI